MIVHPESLCLDYNRCWKKIHHIIENGFAPSVPHKYPPHILVQLYGFIALDICNSFLQ
jgi:hypothetical protein